MNLDELKKSISAKIDQVVELDLSKLYPDNDGFTPWNGLSRSDIQGFVDNTVEVLALLNKDLEVLDFAGFNYVRTIDDTLANLISEIESLNGVEKNQITTQHHSALNQVEGVNKNLRVSGIYSELRLDPKLAENLENIGKAAPLAKNLVQNTEKYQQAISSAEKWSDVNINVKKSVLEEHADNFIARAEEHRIIKAEKICGIIPTGNYYWLIGVVIFAVLLWYFLGEKIELTVIIETVEGTALKYKWPDMILRFTKLALPAYFMLFSMSQFLYHKRMYEIYSFKHVALRTMAYLIETNEVPLHEKVLDRALGVIFTEPTDKADKGKYDKQLVTEVMRMLQAQAKG